MKQLIKITAILILFVIIFSEKNLAQTDENPLLITSFNMVPMSETGKVNKIVDSIFVPILKELVDEGYIYSFGQFVHNWGDEWNLNFWYTAKDMASFDRFWDEYVARGNKRHPGAFAQVVKHFQAHKDNIYTIRGQYPVPPKK
jgi:hypothetical protein